MCYLCLEDLFRIVLPKAQADSKKQAVEIKRLLKIAEDEEVCEMGNVVVDLLKEEQYKLSKDM
jgi:hypothetical protein